MRRPDFPLAAVAGAEEVKLSLRLLAIDPCLRGLLICGGRGTGKTVLARSIRALLPAWAPFVEVPPSVTDDDLLGGVDWSATLAAGERRISAGLLARASGGVLFIDHINLLSRSAASHVERALESTVFVGTYDPEDGEPSSLLRNTAGLHAGIDDGCSVEDRAEIVAHAMAFQADAENFVSEFRPGIVREGQRVGEARKLLHTVTLPTEARRRLCEVAVEFGVEGHRAEILAIRAARAHAALCGREVANEQDVEVAVRLVLKPRALSLQRNTASVQQEKSGDLREGTRDAGSTSGEGASRDYESPPIDNPAPALSEPQWKEFAAPSRGRARRRAEIISSRGRYVRSVATDPGHGVVAVEATLRAAAPFQKLREKNGQKIRVLPGDLRFKQFRRKTGIEIIIALDASGSMAANRIQQAKGAVLRLLREAYVHRDMVALVGFRGQAAEVLMRPGRSVELANRALNELPAGGATPLAAGILLALDVAKRSVLPTLLVLLTDGKPNVSSRGEPVWTEIERVAAAVRDSVALPVVVDTSRGLSSSAGARKLAAMLDAEYVALPRMNATAVYESVAGAAASMRRSG